MTSVCWHQSVASHILCLVNGLSLFQKNKINRSYKTQKGHCMIPVQLFSLKHQPCYYRKHSKRHHFLYHFQLHQRKRSSIAHKSHLISWNLQHILKKRYCPRKGNHCYQRPTIADIHLLELQVAIPSQSHKNIASYQKQNRKKSVQLYIYLFTIIVITSYTLSHTVIIPTILLYILCINQATKLRNYFFTKTLFQSKYNYRSFIP